MGNITKKGEDTKTNLSYYAIDPNNFLMPEVVQTIRDEFKKYNKAALMVTHDERVLDLVDTIYRIENGNLTLEKRN